MPAPTLPTLPIARTNRARGRYTHLDHYLLAPFASTERHYQRIVVIDPESVEEPTLLLRRATTRAMPRNVLALALPSLDTLTVPVAQAATRMGTDWFGLREWPLSQRRTPERAYDPARLPTVSHHFAR